MLMIGKSGSIPPPPLMQVRFLLICRGLVRRELGSIPSDWGSLNTTNSGEHRHGRQMSLGSIGICLLSAKGSATQLG